MRFHVPTKALASLAAVAVAALSPAAAFGAEPASGTVASTAAVGPTVLPAAVQPVSQGMDVIGEGGMAPVATQPTADSTTVDSPTADSTTAEPTSEPATPTTPGATPAAVDINLLGITDFHGHISRTTDPATGAVLDPGAVTLACEVSAARASTANTLFVSAGDSVGASAYVSSVLADQPTIDVLNAIGLDASALGGHELDKGLEDFTGRILPAANFPFLAANVSGSPALSAEGDGNGTRIVEVDGVRVALVGVSTDGLSSLPSLSGLTVSPAVAAANARAAELKDGDAANGEAEVVIVLSHEDANLQAGAFTGNVDAVFAGHSHQVYAQTLTTSDGEPIAVVQADHYGWGLGRISLRYDPATKAVSVVAAENQDLRASTCTTDAYGVAGIVQRAESDAVAAGTTPVARIGSDFLRGVSSGTESTAANLIADSFRHWLATDIQPADSTHYVGLMNAAAVGGDYLYAAGGSEGDGVLTAAEANTVQPFGYEMVYTTLTGAELTTLLSQQWQPGTAHPMLALGLSSNVQVIVNPDAEAELSAIQADLAASGEPASSRQAEIDAARARLITQVIVDDQILTSTDAVVVASNSSLMSGGDGYEVLDGRDSVSTDVLDRDVTTNYLASAATPMVASYSRHQIGMGMVRNPEGTITLNLNGLAYTPASEQTLGAQRVRVMNGATELTSTKIDVAVDANGPTTGTATLTVTVPPDAPSGACRTIDGARCRSVTVEVVDAQGNVLNSLLLEVSDVGSVVQPGANQESTVTPAIKPQAAKPGGGLARTGTSIAIGALGVALLSAGGLIALRRRAAKEQQAAKSPVE